jgi:hypothetical protein
MLFQKVFKTVFNKGESMSKVFTVRIATIDEATGNETLVFETRNNDLNQTLELEEGLLALFNGILKKQKSQIK